MTEEILKTLDELRQRLYHSIESCLIDNNGEITFKGYQTEITNLKLFVNKIFMSDDNDKEKTIYVSYKLSGNDELFTDELYCFNTDDMFNILRNIKNEME